MLRLNCTALNQSESSNFFIYIINNVEEKVVVIHCGRCNNKVYYRLSHDVVTWDVDRDVSTAYC